METDNRVSTGAEVREKGGLRWLVDASLSARVGDFNNTRCKDQHDLVIRARRPVGLEMQPTTYLGI